MITYSKRSFSSFVLKDLNMTKNVLNITKEDLIEIKKLIESWDSIFKLDNFTYIYILK